MSLNEKILGVFFGPSESRQAAKMMIYIINEAIVCKILRSFKMLICVGSGSRIVRFFQREDMLLVWRLLIS